MDVQIGAPHAVLILDHLCMGVLVDCSAFVAMTDDYHVVLLPDKAFDFFLPSLPNCALIEADFDDDGESDQPCSLESVSGEQAC